MEHKCSRCGEKMHQYHLGNRCYQCQSKELEEQYTDVEDLVDAEGYAAMLGLDSAEQLKRIARKGVLAPRIPEIRQWGWRRKEIEAWFKQKQRAGDVFRTAAMGIASNLRTCRNDPIIYISLSDKIGSKVYGAEYIFGTGYRGEVGPMELVKIDRSVASNVLKHLPKENFPELIGIIDWGDLTYDRINEDLIVRLEAYF